MHSISNKKGGDSRLFYAEVKRDAYFFFQASKPVASLVLPFS